MERTARPLFDLELGAAARCGTSDGVPASSVRRLRALLLCGRDQERVRRDAPGVWRRLGGSRALVETTELKRTASPDGAIKLLVGLVDGKAVETVILPTARGVSVCLSTQVGCPIGCLFCASGQRGLDRNLEAHEIVEQVVHARRARPDIDRMVIMGIGEPLLNCPSLFPALETIWREGGIGPRRTVVSTVGVRGGIPRLAARGRRISLAVSLHAPDDDLRRRLIPGVAALPIRELLEDVDGYVRATRNKVVAAYTLLGGVNDADELARRTGRLLAGRQIYLNCIPYNPVRGAPFEPVSDERAMHFTAIVRASGAFATVRRTLGGLQHAACGQLRAASPATIL